MNLRDTLRALRDGWWLVAVVLLGCIIASAAVTLLSPRMYTADTRLFISTTGSATDLTAALQGSELAQQRATSYASYLTDLQLAQAVVDDLDLDMTATELSEEISATVVPDTVILDVQVTDRSAEQAQAIAASIGSQFPELVADLETPEGSSVSSVQVSVIAEPQLPTEPSSPKPLTNVAVGLFLGLVLGCGTVIARFSLDTRLRDVDVINAVSRAPGLAVVPVDPALSRDKVLWESGDNPAWESFRQLRTNLDFLDVDEPPRSLLVTSALPGEGKSTVAVNLALALVAAGRTVALVEADLRRPRVTRYLGLVSGAGVTSVLSGSVGLSDVLQEHGDGRLRVLAAGRSVPNPGELLSSRQMQKVLAELRATHDIVLLDGPPLLPAADAHGLAPHTDGVLLCVRHGSTRHRELELAVRAVDQVGARILGTVTTFVPRQIAAREGVGYSYRYRDEAAKRHWWNRKPGSDGEEVRAVVPPRTATPTVSEAVAAMRSAPAPAEQTQVARVDPDGGQAEPTPSSTGRTETATDAERSPVPPQPLPSVPPRPQLTASGPVLGNPTPRTRVVPQSKPPSTGWGRRS